MKKILSLIGSAILLALISTGCATTGTTGGTPPISVNPTNGIISVFGNPIDPVVTGNTIKGIAQAGAAAAIQYDKNSVSYLQLAETTLDLAVTDGKYDPATLASALANISVKEARDPKVTQGVMAALNIYAIFAGQVVTADVKDVSPYLKPALEGLRDGIKAALAMNAPTPTP